MINTLDWGPERWDAQWRYYMRCTYRLALASPDPSTQNASVLLDDKLELVSSGFNAFPEGVKYTDERWERPAKYDFIEHAERNSIFRAAKRGLQTGGTIMVCPWAACSDCARAIVCAGVTKLVRHQDASDRSPERWIESIKVADTILQEGGVEILDLVGPVGHIGAPLLHTGELWMP